MQSRSSQLRPSPGHFENFAEEGIAGCPHCGGCLDARAMIAREIIHFGDGVIRLLERDTPPADLVAVLEQQLAEAHVLTTAPTSLFHNHIDRALRTTAPRPRRHRA